MYLLLNIKRGDVLLFVMRLKRMLLDIIFAFNFLNILNYLGLLILVPISEYWHTFPYHNKNLTRIVEIRLNYHSEELVKTSRLDRVRALPLSPVTPLHPSLCSTCMFQVFAVLNMHVPSHRNNWDFFPCTSSFFPLVTGLKSLTRQKCLKF